MVPLIVVLAVVVALGSWMWFLYRQSVDRPFWAAFGATAAAVFFSVTGLAGYTLSKHDRFVTDTTWVDHVIWSQVAIGLLGGFLAVYYWRRALRGRPRP